MSVAQKFIIWFCRFGNSLFSGLIHYVVSCEWSEAKNGISRITTRTSFRSSFSRLFQDPREFHERDRTGTFTSTPQNDSCHFVWWMVPDDQRLEIPYNTLQNPKTFPKSQEHCRYGKYADNLIRLWNVSISVVNRNDCNLKMNFATFANMFGVRLALCEMETIF